MDVKTTESIDTGFKNLELFRKAVSVSNINTVLALKDGSNLEETDNYFRSRLYENYSYEAFYSLLREKVRPGKLVRIQDQYQFTYLFLQVPKNFVPGDASGYLSIGPFTDVRKGREDILLIMHSNNIPVQLLSDLTYFYDSVPVVPSTDALECLILCLASGLFQEEYHLERLPEYDTIFPDASYVLRETPDDPRIAVASIEERYSVENELLTAIGAGDYDRAHSVYQKFLTYHISPRTENPIRNQQHLAVIMNTLCRKTAETSGVHPLYIDDLSTKFAIAINNSSSLKDLGSLVSDMIHKYCILVKNYAMKGYSAVTKDIISYIDFHYTEDLSLSFFAEMFNLTKTYLSSLFKKETGISLTDFIHQVRMRKAIILINSSALPVTSIATACGYNDINYFIRIFKRTYGLSPVQYRKSIVHP